MYNGEDASAFEFGIFQADSLSEAFDNVDQRYRTVRREEGITCSRVVLRRGREIFDLSGLLIS